MYFQTVINIVLLLHQNDSFVQELPAAVKIQVNQLYELLDLINFMFTNTDLKFYPHVNILWRVILENSVCINLCWKPLFVTAGTLFRPGQEVLCTLQRKEKTMFQKKSFVVFDFNWPLTCTILRL